MNGSHGKCVKIARRSRLLANFSVPPPLHHLTKNVDEMNNTHGDAGKYVTWPSGRDNRIRCEA